ncbi:hypothetical protein C4580_06040 [Candidatus Woesearchaeota archaeon]|nr:MAG: hypothetical protein C4580_06040 [Candidatus Woesearchaeota archaeon]
MPAPFAVTSLELSFHILLFGVAVATPLILYFAYLRFARGQLRTIVGFLTLSFVFGALRWIGGSLARLDLPVTNQLWFNFAWTVSGVLAAVFALYAANALFTYSKTCDLCLHGKPKGKRA